MDVSSKNNGPVVIGGLGGSGTRVVAEIMAVFDYYLGPDLNSASDNLWYTFLFKRPGWYLRYRDNQEMIATGLSLFEKLMLRTSFPTFRELCYLAGAFYSMSVHGFSHKHLGEGRTRWAFRRLVRMATASPGKERSFAGWGWKEPNSHLLLENMAAHFGHLRYIHTIRHGLDMAFSDKQTQLYMWGPLFGVEVPLDQHALPVASYRYWVNANRHAVGCGRSLREGHFLLVNYDRLCAEPQTEIAKIAAFLGITPTAEILRKACALVRPQKTSGRYLRHGTETFRGEDLDALQEFGFSMQMEGR